ncbi:CRISPR-associated endoribonuclease Cas6 [Tengunoibacter tsumagoiensis]|uniref:Uncharacterized protein n=1 Tax=Tengunoibacter tsumagoiensis TaxID=2014871 RepID=A0A402A7V2_9CHLR|nr:CRISPR-associated endoribonuclease Cas6 [Tengunoibacter tsumagoiensis]GCE15247.1 hypothetical protein KTT_51060 [Tengunoibacter tsumagoiensis]
MQHPESKDLNISSEQRGELFSILIRLHPIAPGQVSPSSGPQIQAAFLDLIHQSDPALSQWLHEPNQRRPYTLSLLQGFHHLPPERLADAMANNRPLPVLPGQSYWLRITMLDATIFGSFVSQLFVKAHTLTFRIGEAQFSISRVINAPDPQQDSSSWASYSSFAELSALRSIQKQYTFEFATPTAFSKGQKAWGKQLFLFPLPSLVFENLARQWEIFAPAHLRLATQGLTSRDIENWCDEQMIVSYYTLETRYLSAHKFGHVGFQGKVTYEVKGNPGAPIALWLPSLARLALFSGIGYKTTVGMGQVRAG